MPFRALAFLLVLLYSGLGRAVCPPHDFTDPARIRIQGDAVMIVVHATSTHDARYSAKRGVDEAVRFAKSRKIPVIYLQDDTPGQYYYMADCQPDHWVSSQGGEIGFDVPPSHLYIVGGHLELCLSAALHDILYQWAKKSPRILTVTYLMDAIYSNGKLVEPTEPYYGDFVKFMNVVTHGRAGGEHWPKLSLLETMGVIIREDHEMAYLKQVLPRWDKTFPASYRVEMQLNDSVKKVLRPAAGWHPPTLLFHFVDSAISLTDVPRQPNH
jgi:hypothetical protein